MARFLTPAFSLAAGPWDPSHRFETSWLLGPWLLFLCRALISTYLFATLFFIIGWTCANPSSLGGCTAVRRSFSYFTVLAYWGQAFYFLAAALHTLSYARTARSLLARLPPPLRALHALLYTTVVSFAPLISAVYWALLFRSPWFALTFDAWTNVSQHALNCFFALFELLVPRIDPPPGVHIVWLIAILLAYLAVAFITAADQHFYTYRFLDHDAVGGRAYVAAYILGIAVGVVVVFGLVYGLICLRRWLTETKLGMRGKFATQSVPDVEMVCAELTEPQSKSSATT